MGQSIIVWFALLGAGIAAACACGCAFACAWLARSARPLDVTMQSQPAITAYPPASQPQVLPAVQHPPHPTRQLVLTGRYPGLGQALGSWMLAEPDPIERIRIAEDLARCGGADAARALLDGVRTGQITPTIAADNLTRCGFDAGVAVTAALQDPDPRVNRVATSLVSRTTRVQSFTVGAARPAPQQRNSIDDREPPAW